MRNGTYKIILVSVCIGLADSTDFVPFEVNLRKYHSLANCSTLLKLNNFNVVFIE